MPGVRAWRAPLIGKIAVATWRDLAQLAADLDAAMHGAVDKLRSEQGHSWTEIASVLGTSRQAAHKRFGRSE